MKEVSDLSVAGIKHKQENDWSYIYIYIFWGGGRGEEEEGIHRDQKLCRVSTDLEVLKIKCAGSLLDKYKKKKKKKQPHNQPKTLGMVM